MELIYLLIEKCHRLGEHKPIEFTGEFNFTLNEYSKEKRRISLRIAKNPNHLINYFQSNIANITAIIGSNGVGKTTLLEFLRRLLTNSSYTGDKWLAVYKVGDEIKVVHTLYDTLSVKGGDNKYFHNEWQIDIVFNNTAIEATRLHYGGIAPQFVKLSADEDLKQTKVIYYSGIFDLKGYPFNLDPPYIDLSTNFLIEEDSEEEEYTLPDKSLLLKHKHKNILRQFKLLELNRQLIDLDLPTPTQINVIFELAQYDASESRDLSVESRRIFEYFRKRIGEEEYNIVNNQIEEERKIGGVAYQKVLRSKTKLRFIDALIYNFFKNLDTADYLNYDLGIDLQTFKPLDVFSAALYLFENQSWTKKRSAYNIGGFVKLVYSILDDDDNWTKSEHDDNVLIVKDNVNVAELLSDYENYTASLPISNVEGFLNIAWRDMSSGQKAIVDLYSRLLFAKVKIKEEYIRKNGKTELKPFDCLYILLDEAEIGYHPRWQREYLQKVETFISFLFMEAAGQLFHNTKIQLILTSHSPFLASDLPKSNLVFLGRKDEDTIDPNDFFQITNISHEETLGANIHTLLSDSFFMNKGLIGTKVEKQLYIIIELLTNSQKNAEAFQRQDEIVNFIRNFGEPLIQQRLEGMYKEMFGVDLTQNLNDRYNALKIEMEKIEAIRRATT